MPIYRRPILPVQFHDYHEPFVWPRIVPASDLGQSTIHHVWEVLILARRLKGEQRVPCITKQIWR